MIFSAAVLKEFNIIIKIRIGNEIKVKLSVKFRIIIMIMFGCKSQI
jgi:hypothetical protein